jgi:hypothetical protein
VVLETQKGRITAHDIVGISRNRRLQEFVIIGITANCSCERNGFDHFGVKLDDFED